MLLSFYGRRGTVRKRFLRREPTDVEHGLWARLARSIMARPYAFLVGGTALLLAAAAPAFYLKLTPGSTFGIPRTPQAVRGFDVLRHAVGPGAVAPAEVLVHTSSGSVLEPAVQAAVERLVASARHDLEVVLRLAPLDGACAVATDLGELRGAVERDPAHQLRRDVVLRCPARFPDPLVGFAPHLARALGLRLDDRPQPPRQSLPVPGVQEHRVEHRAEHVVLALVVGAVADPDGPRTVVAGELVAGRFRQVATTVDPVHDLQ